MNTYFGDFLPRVNELVLAIARTPKRNQQAYKTALINSVYDTWTKVFRGDQNLICKRALQKKMDKAYTQFRAQVLKKGMFDSKTNLYV